MSTLDNRRQAMLELEHQAVWLFGTIAARSSLLRELALSTKKQRESARDEIRTDLLAAGKKPSPPLPGYPSEGLDNDGDMQVAARSLLSQLSVVQLDVVGLTQGEDRAAAVSEFTLTSTSLTLWGDQPTAFPGLDPSRNR